MQTDLPEQLRTDAKPAGLTGDGVSSPLPVDIHKGRRVVRTDQNVLALKTPSEVAQGQEYC